MALTRDAVIRFLVERQGIDACELESEPLLFSGGLLDSFTMADLIQFLEEEGGFEVAAADATLSNLDSVDRILAYARTRG